MRKSEILLHSVFGIIRPDIRPFAYALDILVEYLFVKRIPQGDIHITKVIYPAVALELGKTTCAVSRSIERLANLFWDTAYNQGRIIEFFGRPLYDTPSTNEILFYLAFFLHFEKPFFAILDDLSDLDSPA